jgi:creatinine amidohydrolase
LTPVPRPTRRVPPSRAIGDLTYQDVSLHLSERSILCLPMGAIEQHGPHLPLATDVIVAEGLTRAIVTRWGDDLDLWQLPTLSVGLSREHAWAPGTLSFSVERFAGMLGELVRELLRALPARNLAIVNGHGGNRGILEGLLVEWASELALNACVIHPFDLARAATGSSGPDVHGGRSETSLMLALAGDLVHRDLIEEGAPTPEGTARAEAAIAAMVVDRGATWPWRTDDPRLAQGGIIGDPRGASAELGRAILESVVAESRGVLARLAENQALMRPRAPRDGR